MKSFKEALKKYINGLPYGSVLILPILVYCRKLFFYICGFIAYPICKALNIRFLYPYPLTLLTRIGHLCIEIDCFIKEGILNLRPQFVGVILAPGGKVANNHLMTYWRQYEGKYITIIKSPTACVLLKALANNRITGYSLVPYVCVTDKSASYVDIVEKYQGFPPLISLSKSDYKFGYSVLQKLGMPQDAYFVCVHCREDGYVSGENQLYRNGDIMSFIPAIKYITENGGWVIRMGDSTMKHLPPMDHVIDYAHSDEKSEQMDIFLCASCKFFLGCSSGLVSVAHIFGVPVVSVNSAPMSMLVGYRPDDISIPKLIWSDKEHRLLTFKEVFNSDISNFRFDNLYADANVNVVDNTQEDIRAITIEMLAHLEGEITYSEEDEKLQISYKSMMNPSHYSFGTISRIGRDFLRKYKHLL